MIVQQWDYRGIPCWIEQVRDSSDVNYTSAAQWTGYSPDLMFVNQDAYGSFTHHGYCIIDGETHEVDRYNREKHASGNLFSFFSTSTDLNAMRRMVEYMVDELLGADND